MNTGKNRAAIELEAAAWLRARDSGEWTRDDQARFDAWLADTHNRVAYLRLEAAWGEMNRLHALGAGYARGTVPSPDQLNDLAGDPADNRVPAATPERSGIQSNTEARAHTPTRAALPGLEHSRTRRPLWPLFSKRVQALAATVLLMLGTLVYLNSDYFAGTRFSTPTGAVTTVPLKDGSNVTLSTASTIRVRLEANERRIELAQGEAFFEVAHDPTRPFVVHAANKRITAVGTKFSVRRDGNDIRVIVTEGKVRLEEDGATTAPALLTAGTVARAGSVQELTLPEAEEQLSWRQGFVVFHETALADAVAEFNRYNERKIFIADPKVASIKLSGKFRATNIDTLVSLLEQTYGIHAARNEDRITLNTE